MEESKKVSKKMIHGGVKAFKEAEIKAILRSFLGAWACRNKALFLVGIKSGYRISELLSLRVEDVIQNGKVVDILYIRRRNMKGKMEGRAVPLHKDAQAALMELVDDLWHRGYCSESIYLFQSQKGTNAPMTRQQAYRVIHEACKRAGVSGRIGTHSLRKTFAHRVFEKTGRNLFLTQKALGHKDINNTIKYLSYEQDEVSKAILAA